MSKEVKKMIQEVQEMIIKIIDKNMTVDYTISEDIANEIISALIERKYLNDIRTQNTSPPKPLDKLLAR